MSEIIRFNNVVKKFNDKTVLDNISFSVDEGDIFGYLGPNGAGKTTSIRMMLGILEPTEGQIEICGMNSIRNEVRKKIGFCLDDEGLYPDLTAIENMEFYDRIYNSEVGRKKRILDLLELFEIDKYADKLVSEFSKGMKRRLGLAKALLNKPEVLILDEPTDGLDPDGQYLVKRILRNISKETTIFFSSHNLSDVENICTKVAIIKKDILFCDKMCNIANGNQVSIIISSDEDNADRINSYKRFVNDLNISNFGIVNDRLNINVSSVRKDEIVNKIINSSLQIDSIYELNNKIENLYFDLVKGGEK
ncbi:ABC-2 type transport system ATP-binding protein [Clostridium sp. DSM 8431]|uniref:ABC transporter ATP-binding protein n=1 Tax=Clostridium sp. DSM 8431 TaxID=1761781 RepID=UPI0008ECB4AA|nr:ABC transporter ATP-binding protein [Clostridium sp. DSM 8431]SFU59916.1 ABC-2 type transport system ATP-binding protein [Clostridium sp. DSM 8431]